MDLKNEVKNIQAAGYNGARTVILLAVQQCIVPQKWGHAKSLW